MSTEEDWIQFYPEIWAAGSLRVVLAKALENLGSPLVPTDSDKWFPEAFARIAKGERFSQIYVAALKRLFLTDFWSQGVCMALGNCADLPEAAAAVRLWVTSPELGASGLAVAFPWISAKEGAEAFEQGKAVDCKWEKIQSEEVLPNIKALIARAANEPRLRLLFPYMSMHTLCFSRCTGYPFTSDIPGITCLAGEEYAVRMKDGRELGRGTAESAVQLVIEHLPPNCGSVRAGTADSV